jgi:hypothetical protein
MKRILPNLLLLALVGCTDPLKDPASITDVRVLGARVEVDSAPERATPAPGESASVRWLVAAPQLEPEFAWSLVACESAYGAELETCDDYAFARASEREPTTLAPELAFSLPDSSEAPTISLLGMIAGTAVRLDVPVATETLSNRNPALDADAISFDGFVWNAGTDCAELPEVGPGSKHTLSLALAEDDREPLVTKYSADPERETLRVSHFSTHGELERAFSSFGADARELDARLSWIAPRAAESGDIMRFYFVVRDLRGGSDWLERAVCFEP